MSKKKNICPVCNREMAVYAVREDVTQGKVEHVCVGTTLMMYGHVETLGAAVAKLCADRCPTKLIILGEDEAGGSILVHLFEWAEAVRELESASSALKTATANTYPELWEREHAAVKNEAAKREALLLAADPTPSAKTAAGGDGGEL